MQSNTSNSSGAIKKFTPSDYKDDDKLYRGYRLENIDKASNDIKLDTIRFADFSCNWSRFSKPEGVKERYRGSPADGCFSFTVKAARYKNMATPCHDPQPNERYPHTNNYSHTEVRQLMSGELISIEPPHGRKLDNYNWCNTNKIEYRQNIINEKTIEFEPTM
jgi:hypothetical protein